MMENHIQRTIRDESNDHYGIELRKSKGDKVKTSFEGDFYTFLVDDTLRLIKKQCLLMMYYSRKRLLIEKLSL